MYPANRIIGIFASLSVLALGTTTACSHQSGDQPLEVSRAPDPPTRKGGPAPLHKATDETRIDNEYIVVFTEGGREAARASELTTQGGSVGHVYSRVLTGFSVRLSDSASLTRLRAHPDVAYIEEDAELSRPMSPFTPTTQSSAPWHLERIDVSPTSGDDYQWSEPTPSNSKIYIVDTGVRGTHNEFSGRMGTGWYTSGAGSTDDCFGHGTNVASAAAGTTYGAAKDATIIPLNTDDSCDGEPSTSDVVDGLEWIESQSDDFAVVNISLHNDGGSNSFDTAVEDLIADKYIVVVAAGNDDDDACEDSPSRVDDAITVGAITDDDERWDDFDAGSNHGSCVDIWAPGAEMTLATNESNSATLAGQRGTSIATPIVSGIIYAAQTEKQSTLDVIEDVMFGDIFSGTTGSAISGELSNLGSGSPNLLIYGPRSYAEILGVRVVTEAESYTWISRARGGDEGEFSYEWETSTNGTTWTTVSTTDRYTRSFDAGDEFTLHIRLTVTNEFGDEPEHEIEVDVDVPCTGPMCPG